ncbi:MAG: acyl carrier protein [Limisphaerales bacterium]|jgi:acyl carrier protein
MKPDPNKMQEELLGHLQNHILNPGTCQSIRPGDDLLNSGLVDSMGMMEMIHFIESRYKIRISPEDQVIENFISIDAMAGFIQGRCSDS